jgi:hypothetical protein
MFSLFQLSIRFSLPLSRTHFEHPVILHPLDHADGLIGRPCFTQTRFSGGGIAFGGLLLIVGSFRCGAFSFFNAYRLFQLLDFDRVC